MSPEMVNTRILQGVTQPDFVRVGFEKENTGSSSDFRSASSYRTCKELCQELWMEANKHDSEYLAGFWRKSPQHLFKIICNLKIVRLIFNLLTKRPFGEIRCDQGDRAHKMQKIPRAFLERLKEEMNTYVDNNCRLLPVGPLGNERMFRVMMINEDDVNAAYRLLKYQLETARIFFSIDHLRENIAKRIGRPFRSSLADSAIPLK